MAESDNSKSLPEDYLLKDREEKLDIGTKPAEETTENDAVNANPVDTTVDSSGGSDAAPEENDNSDKDVTQPPPPTSEESSQENTDDQTLEIKLETAPGDYRFPTTNQSRHCFTRYVEYHRCVAAKGEGAPECDKFAKYYRSLCPGEWVDRWNEQRENGTFPGPL